MTAYAMVITNDGMTHGLRNLSTGDAFYFPAGDGPLIADLFDQEYSECTGCPDREGLCGECGYCDNCGCDEGCEGRVVIVVDDDEC